MMMKVERILTNHSLPMSRQLITTTPPATDVANAGLTYVLQVGKCRRIVGSWRLGSFLRSSGHAVQDVEEPFVSASMDTIMTNFILICDYLNFWRSREEG